MSKSLVIVTLSLLSLVPAQTYAQNPVIARSSYEDALANDAGFISNLDGLITKAATAIRLESGGTTNHAARLAFANKVLQGSRPYAARMAGYIIHLDNFEGQTIQIAPLGSGFAVTIATTYDAAYGNVFAVWDALAELFG